MILNFLITSLFTKAQGLEEGTTLTPLEKEIYNKVKYVEDNNLLTDQLTEEDLEGLPIGIAKRVGDATYIIAIDNAVRAESGWLLSAYAAIEMPGATKKMAFAGLNIAFGKKGLSATTSTRLMLASPQMIDLSDAVTLELPADGRNYIEFNCGGFESINLKGLLLLEEGLVTPDKSLAPAATRVTGTFEINTKDLHNIVVSTSLTPFQITGLEGISFTVKNAVLDMSDIANPNGFSFPQDYQNTYGPNIQLWRGFYTQEVTVALPKELTGKNGRIALQGKSLMIDESGVSGVFSALNLTNLEDGSLDGWPFSINRVSIAIIHNELKGGGFGGEMNIPFLGDEPLGYSADMTKENGSINYAFLVTVPEGKEFTVPFAGLVTLEKNCTVGIQKIDGKLMATANLHGNLTLNHKLLKVQNIKFESLLLATQKPYVRSGYFTLSGDGQGTTNGFPVGLESLELAIFEGQLSIGGKVFLSMMNSEDKGFKAETFVRVLAKVEEQPVVNGEIKSTRQKWKLDKVKVEDIILSCNTTVFSLNGRLTLFQDDITYGDGFRGSIALKIKNVLENGIQVNAYFGAKEYRYWHVDAYVPVGNIPVVPPVLSITGIIGGMSYHMVRSKSFVPDFNKLNVEAPTSNTGNAKVTSASDFVYVPDKTAGVAFMAGVTLIAGNEKAMNGDVVLEVAFNDNGGGIKYIQFNGSAYFFTAASGRKRGMSSDASAPCYASLKMLYDNDNNVFHANLATYLNMGVIKGTGPSGLIGEAVIHVDKKDWYIHIGRPTAKLGIDIAGFVSTRSYFMVGTKIEPPVLDAELVSLFGKEDRSSAMNTTLLSSGSGFAFGLSAKAGFDAEITPFYAMFSVGAGTDIMLMNSRKYCEGRGANPVGISGWYGGGTAYVYLKGAVGLRFKNKRFDIARVGAGAMLTAKLPNPTYLEGRLAGEYSILGGLVDGSFSFSFTVGEECKIINTGNDLGDLMIISSVKPDNGGQEINVFTAPQVSFNVPLGKELPLLNVDNETKIYRVVMDEFRLTHNEQEIQGEHIWNVKHDVVSFKTRDILPPNSDLKLIVRLHWEKKIADGVWEPLKEDGKIDYEAREVKFKTSEAPLTIPDENIAYTYPVKNQYHLHKDETNKGYIKLKWGQEYLFKSNDPLTQYSYVIRFKTAGGKLIEKPFTYRANETYVDFDIPSELMPETVYQVFFVKVPKLSEADANVARATTSISTNSSGNTVKMKETSLTGSVSSGAEKDLYTTVFRTSKYATFSDRMASMSQQQDLFNVATGNIAVIAKRAMAQEVFDKFELEGDGEQTQPLIQCIATTDNKWYSTFAYPIIYEHYASSGQTIGWRSPVEEHGVPPLKGVRIGNVDESEDVLLSEGEKSAGFAQGKSGRIVIEYYLSHYAYNDYQDLLNKAANAYLSNKLRAPEGARRLLESKGYVDLMEDKYPVKLSYTLPGTNHITSEKEFKIKF
ncbi:MAG TPA: hypothetical protein VF691_12260 [Cytophagaceae bacterium]